MLRLWAQVPGTDPTVLPMMALRRWFAGLTLSSPEPTPSPFGLWAWLAGLGALLAVVMVVQGPFRALRQAFDVLGHARLMAAAAGRLRRSSRLLAVLLGAAVLSWTVWQFRSFGTPERLEELLILLKSRGIGEAATEQGALAALTPLRDLAGLGDTLVLLVAASALVFKLSADRWGGAAPPHELGGPAPPPPWTTLAWGSAWLYVMYRLAAHVMAPEGLPLESCLFVEVALVPAVMLLSDALLLGWVLNELRRASSTSPDDPEGLDVSGAVAMLPYAMVACLVALPARYVAAVAWLLPTTADVAAIKALRSWLLAGRGLIALQGASLASLGLVAVLARGRGRAVVDTFRLLYAEGGRLVVTLAGASALAGGLSAVAYAALLSMPAQPWVLYAADSYAHYATLPVGLLLLAALVELGGRIVPIRPHPAAVAEARRPAAEPDHGEPIGFDAV